MNKLITLTLIAFLALSCGKQDDVVLIDQNITSEAIMQGQIETLSTYSNVDLLKAPTAAIKSAELRSLNTKQKFVCGIYQSVNAINDSILYERAYFKKLFPKIQNGTLTSSEELWLIQALMKYRMVNNAAYYTVTKYTAQEIESRIAAEAKRYQKRNGLPSSCKYTFREDGKYKSKTNAPIDSYECRDEFLRRAQIIAPGMAVAQASLESGWGTSRFATSGNNLYGLQYRFSDRSEVTKRPYCIAAKKDPNRCLYKFVNLADGIKEYYRFLNAGTYQPVFRKHRGASDIKLSSCSSSIEMIQGLTNYAENANYIDDVADRMYKICPMINNCSI